MSRNHVVLTALLRSILVLLYAGVKPSGIFWIFRSDDFDCRHAAASENDFLLMEDFARANDTDGETTLDARAGRAICATVLAAIESGRCGRPLDLD